MKKKVGTRNVTGKGQKKGGIGQSSHVCAYLQIIASIRKEKQMNKDKTGLKEMLKHDLSLTHQHPWLGNPRGRNPQLLACFRDHLPL